MKEPSPSPKDRKSLELYKLEDAYFVLDGHHRVSVARYHDVPTLEATVAEFRPKRLAGPAPATAKSRLAA